VNPPDCLELYADADFYDQEFSHLTHEIPFYLAQARLANGPILEVCCGTRAPNFRVDPTHKYGRVGR